MSEGPEGIPQGKKPEGAFDGMLERETDGLAEAISD